MGRAARRYARMQAKMDLPERRYDSVSSALHGAALLTGAAGALVGGATAASAGPVHAASAPIALAVGKRNALAAAGAKHASAHHVAAAMAGKHHAAVAAAGQHSAATASSEEEDAFRRAWNAAVAAAAVVAGATGFYAGYCASEASEKDPVQEGHADAHENAAPAAAQSRSAAIGFDRWRKSLAGERAAGYHVRTDSEESLPRARIRWDAERPVRRTLRVQGDARPGFYEIPVCYGNGCRRASSVAYEPCGHLCACEACAPETQCLFCAKEGTRVAVRFE